MYNHDKLTFLPYHSFKIRPPTQHILEEFYWHWKQHWFLRLPENVGTSSQHPHYILSAPFHNCSLSRHSKPCYQKNLFTNHHVHHHTSTLHHPSLCVHISSTNDELHTIFPIILSPKLCTKTWKYALLPTLNYLEMYPSERFYWYIVAVKVIGREEILSARMNNFSITKFDKFTILSILSF